MSLQFKRKRAKGNVYNILVVDFPKWDKYFGISKNGKVNKQNVTEVVSSKNLVSTTCACAPISVFVHIIVVSFINTLQRAIYVSDP